MCACFVRKGVELDQSEQPRGVHVEDAAEAQDGLPGDELVSCAEVEFADDGQRDGIGLPLDPQCERSDRHVWTLQLVVVAG